jgi:hypothetical protein
MKEKSDRERAPDGRALGDLQQCRTAPCIPVFVFRIVAAKNSRHRPQAQFFQSETYLTLCFHISELNYRRMAHLGLLITTLARSLGHGVHP